MQTAQQPQYQSLVSGFYKFLVCLLVQIEISVCTFICFVLSLLQCKKLKRNLILCSSILLSSKFEYRKHLPYDCFLEKFEGKWERK